MRVAEPFYDQVLPLLGFEPSKKSSAVLDSYEFHVVEWKHPLLCFAITSPRKAFENEIVNRRKPGALHHLAFKASSREEVDSIYGELQRLGVSIVSAPREYPEYTPPGYYAVFFKDPDGIKYEVVTYPEL